VYEFEHDVFYVALDLAEIDEVVGRLRLVGRNRRSLVAFHDADYLPTPATDLPADIRAHLRSEGVNPAGWRVTLVTNLRVLGYAFNPASFYLCRDASGVLQVVIVEVHNTYGERHLYTLQSREADGRFAASMDKELFVSPFIEAEGRYSVSVRDDREGLRIGINERQDGEHLLSTSLILRRVRLTNRTLARMLLRHPLMSHRTIGLIHWHALRLWMRGATFLRHRAATR
jgi:hypothetical protein